ncbi:hypothetical protein FDUTEX481_07941 [Tolypothrix sp. PCC 7601]|nr:hypothetical protein FDUTEX481_07941 [Tolypothrix sp. PCC 7601]
MKKECDRWVGARHPQSFGISDYLTGAVPLQKIYLPQTLFDLVSIQFS